MESVRNTECVSLKQFKMLLLCCIILSVLIVSVFRFDYYKLRKIDISDREECNELLYNFGQIEIENNIIKNESWAFVRYEDIAHINSYLGLVKQGTTECYILPTSYIERTDVVAAYPDGYEYGNCGLRVNADISQLKFEENSYELVIIYSNDEHNYIAKSGLIVGMETENEETE